MAIASPFAVNHRPRLGAASPALEPRDANSFQQNDQDAVSPVTAERIANGVQLLPDVAIAGLERHAEEEGRVIGTGASCGYNFRV